MKNILIIVEDGCNADKGLRDEPEENNKDIRFKFVPHFKCENGEM